MAGLVGAIHRDVRADITIIRAPTRLAADLAELLNQTLRACLTECPHAVLVDLSRCTEVSPEAMAVVVAAAMAVSTDRPSVLVATCGAPAMVHSACPSYPDCLTAAAEVAATRAGSRRLLHPFMPTNSAAAEARALVRHACWEWNLSLLADTAELVASELVSNAVSHARTEGTLEMTVRGDFVHIRVEDEDPTPPRSAPVASQDVHGRGLHIVRRLSSAVGYRVDQTTTRKVVWSALRWRTATQS